MDGLDQGLATLGINISLEAKQQFFWAANTRSGTSFYCPIDIKQTFNCSVPFSILSADVYYEYVVPYAHVNEAR